jgi:hypothetical protein
LPQHDSRLNRRRFLRTAGAAGLAALAPTAALGQDAPKLPKRTLPGTDLEITPIGYGSEFIEDLGLVDYILKQGVNWIDSAWTYLQGNAERRVGEVLKNRNDVYVFTKPNKAIPPESPKEPYLQCINESLERLQRDAIDILLMHDCRTPEKVESKGAYEAFQEMRDAGKVKYFGLSMHYGVTECVRKATELGWFDMMMPAWNFMSPPELTDALKAAADKGIGIVTIKTVQPLCTDCPTWWFPATEEHRQVLQGDNLFQAAIKWTLSHDFVTGTVIAMGNYDEAAQDIAAASEATLKRGEAEALRHYAERQTAGYCRGCGACERVCPQRIAIADTLRYGVYATGYGQYPEARRKYAALPTGRTVAACADCGACEAACPYGLPVRERLKGAHRVLA